jgi:organic radical activating enzyme
MTPHEKPTPMGAALAGIPSGVRSTGPWAGRRQLFVRFARVAETATMFTAAALRTELVRLAQRSAYHSIAICGGDPLGEVDFLAAALDGGAPLAVMLDHDGQRPESLDRLIKSLALVQVTLRGDEDEEAVSRAMATIRRAADKHVAHALVVTVKADPSDGRLLRIVEQAKEASADTAVVVHPTTDSLSEDRRWLLWLERASAVHGDVRLLPVLPEPTGTRC